VFLCGNHDNYMGTIFGLPEQLREVGQKRRTATRSLAAA
jgi:hypothetical protein